MKKTLFLFTMVAFFYNANAQYYLTVKGGGGLSIENHASTNLGIATWSSIGYKHQISDRLYLAADLGIDGRAHTEKYTIIGDDKVFNFPVSGTYLTIPITVQYAIPFNKKELVPYRSGVSKSYFYLEGGIHNSIGLAGSVFVHPDNPLFFVDLEEDGINPLTAAEMKRTTYDIGVTTGMGFNFGFKKRNSRLQVGTRFTVGFLDIYSSARVGSSTMTSAVGYLGWEFNLAKRKHVTFRW